MSRSNSQVLFAVHEVYIGEETSPNETYSKALETANFDRFERFIFISLKLFFPFKVTPSTSPEPSPNPADSPQRTNQIRRSVR